MQKTELKYWSSGYSVRGRNRKFFAFRIGRLGIMLMNFRPFISLYKLI